MEDILTLFPETYETSRERFRQNLAVIRKYWPDAELSYHRLSGDEDLTIDWIRSGALNYNDKVLIFTTGEHGVEGYVGSAMMQGFINKYIPRLNPRTTGLLLIHAINPWGMKYHRRVNINNVDLNRTFLGDESFDPSFNPDYDSLDEFLNPVGKVKNLLLDNLTFYVNLLRKLVEKGLPTIKHAVLIGQYCYPKGLYYGGDGYQEETRVLIDLYRQAFRGYDQILQLDMHTGYGTRCQMSLVNSVLEARTSQEFIERFDYPLVVATNPQEFYAIKGDMIDYVYALWKQEFQEKKIYSTSFEFGTLGDGINGQVGSPRAMMLENRLHWYGTPSDKISKRIKHDFEELFNPAAVDWRRKAIADADQAFFGILKAEGYLKEQATE